MLVYFKYGFSAVIYIDAGKYVVYTDIHAVAGCWRQTVANHGYLVVMAGHDW
jgi:hypothetical protein